MTREEMINAAAKALASICTSDLVWPDDWPEGSKIEIYARADAAVDAIHPELKPLPPAPVKTPGTVIAEELLYLAKIGGDGSSMFIIRASGVGGPGLYEVRPGEDDKNNQVDRLNRARELLANAIDAALAQRDARHADLLAALSGMLSDVEAYQANPHGHVPTSFVSAARAAIARATGKDVTP